MTWIPKIGMFHVVLKHFGKLFVYQEFEGFQFQYQFMKSNGSDTDSNLGSWDPTIPIPVLDMVLEIWWFWFRFQSRFWTSNDSESDSKSRTLKSLILQRDETETRSLAGPWYNSNLLRLDGRTRTSGELWVFISLCVCVRYMIREEDQLNLVLNIVNRFFWSLQYKS